MIALNAQAHVRPLFLCLTLAASVAWADTPSTDYLFPAGGRQGATVRARMGANFLHGEAEFELMGGGIHAPKTIREIDTVWFEGPMIFKPASQRAENYPRDHEARIEIDEDAVPGVRWWRVRTSQGVTTSRPFIVGRLPEYIEQEIDGKPIPVEVAAPVTINGRIFPREDVDIWTFQATAGEFYRCDVCASDIQSPLDSRLQVYSPDGKLIAENDDLDTVDSAIEFQAASNGLHRVVIVDSQFRGLQNYIYRLTIQPGRRYDQVYPLGARSGAKVKFALSSSTAESGSESEFVERTVQEGPGRRRFPMAIGNNRTTPLLNLDVGRDPELVEWDSPASSFPATPAPCYFNGRIQSSEERDEWALRADQGQTIQLALKTHQLGSNLPARLAIVAPSGKELKTLEMDPARPDSLAFGLQAKETGVYTLRVEGVTPQDTGAYRLHCGLAAPNFELTLDSDAITLYRGQKASLKVTALRHGYNGEITLKATGLPSGVTAKETKIAAKKPNATIELTASEDATVQGCDIQIVGSAEIDQTKRSQTAVVRSPLDTHDRDRIRLGVSMPTPFTLDGVAFETRYGARGTVFRRHYVLHRNGFSGPLTIQLADRQIRHQQGVQADELQLSPEQDEFDFPIRLPTWLEMNRTSRTVVMAVAKVKDEEGTEHTVSFSSGAPKDQIVLLTAPCPINIRTQRASFEATPNESLPIAFTVDRGFLKAATMRVELITPTHMQDITATPVNVAANSTTGEIILKLGRLPGPFNMPVTLRATMMNADGDPVIAETHLELVAATE